jgi:type IV secretion system protein VirD4
MRNDELDISSLGEKKTALFCLIPDNDSSMNFIVGMLYTQAFQELYYKADFQYNGRLPIHVRCIMDEFANVALPDEFGKILSTCRSREISICIIIQAMAQLKALFKDDWESLVGNCDTLLYLGGNEPGTFEYISKLLDKETLATNTYGHTRGRQGSFSTNDQQSGRELLTPGEVRMLDNRYALLFIRGERPVIDQKYDVWHHSRIKEIQEGGAAPYRYEEYRGDWDAEFRFKTYKGLDATKDFDFIDSEDLSYEDAS